MTWPQGAKAAALEPEHVARISAVAPDKVEVICAPDLWPKTRYVADHKGVEGFVTHPHRISNI